MLMTNKSFIGYSIVCLLLLSQKVLLVVIYMKFSVKKAASALVKKKYLNEVDLTNLHP